MVARTLEELLTELRGKVTRLERRLNRVGAGGGGGTPTDPYVLPDRLGGPDGDIPDMGPGVDLNTIKAPGWYIQNANVDATLALNYPVTRAGYLEVNAGLQGAGNDFTLQTYHEYAPASTGAPIRQWTRSQYGTTWYPWVLAAQASTALPAPIRYQETGVANIGATSWGTLVPGFTPPSMTVAKPLWALVTVGMWMQASVGDTRAGLALAGATVMTPPNTAQDGGAATTWGQVAQAGGTDFTATGGSGQRTIQRLVRLNAGTTTFRLEAYMSSAGTHQVNYAVMEIIPLYFEEPGAIPAANEVVADIAGMKMCSGSFTIASIAPDASAIQTPVTFPVGFFAAPPLNISAIGSNGRLNCSYTALTKDGVTILVNNWSPGASPGTSTILWSAFGV